MTQTEDVPRVSGALRVGVLQVAGRRAVQLTSIDVGRRRRHRCIEGIQLDNDQIDHYVHRSLMLVTAEDFDRIVDPATMFGPF